MATLENRSRYCVSVSKRPSLTRHFPFNKLDAVEAYMAELRSQPKTKLEPRVKQLDEHWFVRIRTSGYPTQQGTFDSLEAAEGFIAKVEEERKRGLFVDYTRAHGITFAEILVRYLREELGRVKSAQVLTYKIEGWLEDSGPRGRSLLAEHRAARLEEGAEPRTAKAAMRTPAKNLTWLHKRLPDVTTKDVEDFLEERMSVVAPGTVDREIDTLKDIFKVAINVWDYNLAKNPMVAVRRPTYCNERDRRLTTEDLHRLRLELARIDTERGVEMRLAELATQALHGQSFTSKSARKKVLAQVRKNLLSQAEASADVVPYLETFFDFQVMTAARRGETESLTWDRVDFQAGTAFLPETKNGRPRKLSLRRSLLSLLEELPREGSHVFDIGSNYVTKAWRKACKAAGIADFHIHDLRHEGISRVAETGQFTLPELQQFSGHRDIRMLMRYAHLCASRLAKKLDDCFKDETLHRVHRGRKLLNKKAVTNIPELAQLKQANGLNDITVECMRANPSTGTAAVIAFPAARRPS